ncbi:Spy/CpxP family protein refolding chaperone [Halomonas sp. BC04]|uniref:Spy/CpxP family protein refolding chaperone n=1 Tax=Halomonas sp. BC04 TaxID=1403540 RepID=UPI0003ED6343|nr:Spy/CpxP family protein refolding chaperone [Halomonas sp. BC04]EWH03921.1 hypothetical protein Q427_00670 [Halomonas sp. BC04]
MTLHKHAIALVLAMVIGGTASGAAFAQGMESGQGAMMQGDSQGGMGPGMMSGGQGGMMGGGQGPGMMGGGMGPGMMGGGMGPGMMPCPMMEGGMGMMSMLDPEQRSELRELMQEHRPAQFERMGQMMNLRDDLMAAMHAERPDPDEVQARHGRMAELHGEMMAEMVRMRNAMHDLMTDEQRAQLQQIMPEAADPGDHDAHH